MKEHSVTKRILEVGAGNEEVFSFHSKYNFYPRTIILEQVGKREKKGDITFSMALGLVRMRQNP